MIRCITTCRSGWQREVSSRVENVSELEKLGMSRVDADLGRRKCLRSTRPLTLLRPMIITEIFLLVKPKKEKGDIIETATLMMSCSCLTIWSNRKASSVHG